MVNLTDKVGDGVINHPSIIYINVYGKEYIKSYLSVHSFPKRNKDNRFIIVHTLNHSTRYKATMESSHDQDLLMCFYSWLIDNILDK